jgi:SPP1 gp7 family putative phage head morphogenesis protein
MITRSTYIRNQQIIQNRMIKFYVPKIQKALQDQIKHTVAAVKARGVTSAQGNIHGDILHAEIGKIIQDLYHKAAQLAIRKYKPNLKAGFGVNQDFIDEVMSYFQKFLLEKVVLPISRTTIEQINRILDEAVKEGWGVDRTVSELEDPSLTLYRARMIVRTETVRATNFTQIAAADEEEYEMEKQWIAIEDNRTRKSHSHAGVDGERTAIDEPYSNGLMFPGDPQGSAKETINCRCTQGFFIKRDLNGKPVRKSPQTLSFINRIALNRAA